MMPEKPAPADNPLGRLAGVLAMIGGALAFLFNKWGMIEPVLMSPAGGVVWSIMLLVSGALGYHYAVHAPMLRRLSVSEKKLDDLNKRYTQTFGQMQHLQGQMQALESRNVRDLSQGTDNG